MHDGHGERSWLPEPVEPVEVDFEPVLEVPDGAGLARFVPVPVEPAAVGVAGMRFEPVMVVAAVGWLPLASRAR